MTKFNDLWARLLAAANERHNERIDELLVEEGDRIERFTFDAPGVHADLSKNLIRSNDLTQLIKLSEIQKVPNKIAAMFNGAKINTSENRAVLHTLLRADDKLVDDAEKSSAVKNTLQRIEQFVMGAPQGALGFQPTDIVNIGIGGSHLGPALVCDALRDFRVGNMKSHFVSNVDGALIDSILRELNPQTTIFIVASKSFTTPETLLNAKTAKRWFEQKSNGSTTIEDHFLAISSAVDKALEFGIKAENIFPMWDWVGGRYSLWSAIGLPIALQCGSEHFRQLLAGAAAMDNHFRTSPLPANLPAMLALVGIWHSNFLQASSRAIIPYDDRLKLLPAFLQQLEMESNGKQVSIDGEPLDFETSPIVWGGVGTDAQHAFFQQLHQGTQEVPIDFIICKKPAHDLDDHHKMLIANCLAQAEALMCGTETEINPAKLMIGNHSSNMLVIDELSPYNLGALLAMYEHRTMFQGAVWDINSFDQFGVELGKRLASTILTEAKSDVVSAHDRSTRHLIKQLYGQ